MKGHNSSKAKENLVWYMRMLAQKSGIHWDGDNDAEVEGIIDSIMSEVEERIHNAIENHAHGLSDVNE